MISHLEREQKRAGLIDALHGLTAAERSVIEALSIIYEPTSRTQLLKCLRKSASYTPSEEQFKAKSLNEVVLSLKAKDLVKVVNYNICCNELITEAATRQAIERGFFFKIAHIVENFLKPFTKLRYSRISRYSNYKQALADFRIAVYTKNVKKTAEILTSAKQLFPDEFQLLPPYVAVYNNPFDPRWLGALPEELVPDALVQILVDSFLRLTPAEEAFAFLENFTKPADENVDELNHLMAEQLILRGKPEKARKVLRTLLTEESRAMEGWIFFLQGNNEKALHLFDAAYRPGARGKKHIEAANMKEAGIAELFYPLALVQEGSSNRLVQAEEYAEDALFRAPPELKPAFLALNRFVSMHREFNEDATASAPSEQLTDPVNSTNTLFSSLADFWINAEISENNLENLKVLHERAKESNYLWLAWETAELLGAAGASIDRGKHSLGQKTGLESMVRLMGRQEPWERSIKALADLTADRKKLKSLLPSTRLAWFIEYKEGKCSVQPREQKLKASGEWTKGRLISLKRLYEGMDDIEFLTAKDREICSSLELIYSSRGGQHYSNTRYEFETGKLLAGLVGHPLLFWADAPTVRVEVIRGEPELVVKDFGDSLRIETTPSISAREEPALVKESPTRLKLIEFTKEYRKITDIVGSGLTAPAKAREEVLDVISGLSSIIAIHSDIGSNIQDIDEIEADNKLRVQLIPFGEGLKLQILIKPFSEGGSYYKPGEGGTTLIARIDGRLCQTKRNLERERQAVEALIADCPHLTAKESVNGEWTLDEADACLETLLELDRHGEDAIAEWPVGEKFSISSCASMSNLRINIRRERDWFALDGELRTDDDLVIEMRELIELSQKSPSRFIPLKKGQFLALTESFRQRLSDIGAFSNLQSNELRMHPLAASAMADILSDAGFSQVDESWTAQIEKIKKINKQNFQIPPDLHAELREYQIEGFNWLSRLASWGVGACLADDMGLGKTIQALSVIIDRADEGPSLVVAPTSVCMNWMEEAQRFAPSLRVISFHDMDRENIVNNLQPRDLVVCSYGLLQQQTGLLSKNIWQTIVLDEAQAIKNVAAKRSKAAMQLSGCFKLITTGTPMENHLGELWNLFRFINPGLLGSLASFNERFAGPIERDNNKEAKERLKKLIKPFVLRRTKDQVLKELPPRTEIVIKVEMSSEESAIYAALRQEALEKMENSNLSAEKKRFMILAEIMKLRRACCNPRLVLPDSGVKSGKLEVFGEVLEELLDNNHKALVFSQFVDHLNIIREFLDKKKISYQYLDGSTPMRQRQANVEAFQAGQGDVFLISLKAGGLGLNLTAADYVIHMDPWWNPAVEDQASDRAHRIGQFKPVTIYRLVIKNSIEEKIIKLHNQKRELADSLLQGADASGKISVDELLKLLREP